MAAKKKAPVYIVKVWVQGLREGVKWPLPGETIDGLSESDALEYLNAGYIVPQPDAVEAPTAASAETAVVDDPPAGLTAGTVTTAPVDGETPADEGAAPKPTGLPKVAGK
jgi:hypothetical protein